MSHAIDWKQVAALWKRSERTEGTIGVYLYWARRFDSHCQAKGIDTVASLTLKDVRRMMATYSQRRKGARLGRLPLVATRALGCALRALGYDVPEWVRVRSPPRRIALIESYIEHELRHRGIAERTSRFDAECARVFLEFVRRRRRTVRTIRITDIDAFVISRCKLYVAKTVARICSALRSFLRYLHLTGLTSIDLTVHVASPVVRSVDSPPRAVPWTWVQRILRAIDTTKPLGLRDKALFLMMATYGMGASEIVGLRLDDIDWRRRRIRLRRPKTGVVTDLPLLDPVARALAAYLRGSRPQHASTRAVFVTDHLPHRPISCSTTIRHRLDLYAGNAGIPDGYRGTHLFRHSHATRQIELGQPVKVVGDILGHRHPASTSVYTRSALLRLRALALPVPR
jgi:integrase/recombinase XerD